MNKKVAYITDDIKNINIQKLIRILQSDFDVKLITTNYIVSDIYIPDTYILLTNKKNLLDRLKDSLLIFSSICNSKISRKFHKRNYFRKFKLFLNILHFGKLLFSKFNLLPSHSDIIKFCYSKNKMFDDLINQFDCFICDSLTINNKNFYKILSRVSILKDKLLIANVYSWDNVHYSSLIHFADYFFVWNEQIKKRLINNHPMIDSRKIFCTGPLTIDYLKQPIIKSKTVNKEKYILYAATYCDPIFSSFEVVHVLRIADIINGIDPELKLYFRPYPIIETNHYSKLLQNNSIKIIDYGIYQKLFHDQAIMTRLDDNLQNKKELIKNALLFISLGSTFTLEVAYTETPILQTDFYNKSFGREIFKLHENIHLNDHLCLTLLDYNYPNIVSNYKDLQIKIKSILEDSSPYMPYVHKLKDFIDPYPEASSYHNLFTTTLINILMK